MTGRRSALLSIALASVASAGQAQEWPGRRGPERNGIAAAAQAPATWPDALARAWRVDIGEGYASPVVSGGRVFVHGSRDDREIVTAIDLESGARLLAAELPGPLRAEHHRPRCPAGSVRDTDGRRRTASS